MTAIVVRGLDEGVKARVVERARRNGRSMEAEVRAILNAAVNTPNIGVALHDAVRAAGGVDDLPVPPRSDVARAVDFG